MNIPAELITAIIWALVGVCIWIFQDKTRKYDAHLKDCSERNERVASKDAKFAERLCSIEEHSKHNRKDIQWLGDCMITLGTKLDADLPERPE